MATAATIFELDMQRVFSNTGGGGIAWGGTGQAGTITGNQTGGSGTGSSYSSGGSGQAQGSEPNDPYAGITLVYNPVTSRIDTFDPTLLQSVMTPDGTPILLVGEELVLTLSPSPQIVQGEELVLTLSPLPKIVKGEELVLHLSPAPGGVRGTIQGHDKFGALQTIEFRIASNANDILSGSGILDGRAGDDGMRGSGGADTLLGGTGNDWLDGGVGADVIDGGEGWDVGSYMSAKGGVTVDMTTNLNAGAAAGDAVFNIEVLQGSNHNDRLTGIDNGHGVQLYGEGGNDGLTGKGGGDYLFGGAGNDWLDGGAGGDNIDGGEGWDVLSYQSAASGVAVDLATNQNGGAAAGDAISNIEVVQGSNFADSLVGVDRGGGHGVELHGEGGHDNMRGAAGGDRLYGGAGNDWIAGLAGTDLVHGGDGDDIVGGQEGNDTLSGGYGQDELWGGSGADIFLFDTAVGAGADRLKDFAAAEGDMIRLNHNVFSALGVGLLGSAFKVGAATSASHHILYNSATGDLSYDVDGSGAAAAVKIAMLNPGTTLSAFNFFIV
ncbi:calcium-binding protein [Microvirga sp. 3-52]|uniref:calcium-binding protein n=1 Tax=Microvirga sp. 3-52 TaxID=2792425 RepID=UPI001BCB4C08|nr:calcium-binding protein [Microvirga sp. 3-52]MBS7452932.1 calcium-binding protein [Microvirga sp. 3-52]